MDENPRVPQPPPAERVEHREVVERTPASPVERPRGTTPIWVWLLPLVLVVLALVWYILTTGQPSSPVGSAPEVELPAVQQDVQEIQIDVDPVVTPGNDAAPADAPGADSPADAPPADAAPPGGGGE